jgi:ribokinase
VIDVVVVGQVARDLVLLVDEMPAGGQTSTVHGRREMLGGKGANQAVALAQLGMSVALVGVVGDDEEADKLLAQARSDDVDVSPVVRRAGTRSGLIVDVVDGQHTWHYLEDLPDEVLLTDADVEAAAPVLRAAAATVVQLQQPSTAALAAARQAKAAGRMVVLDGAPAPDDRRTALLDAADVLRADTREAELIAGTPIATAADAVRAGEDLLHTHRLLMAALAIDDGNVFVWDGGHQTLPLLDTEVVDTTGAGDAFTAALTSMLCRGGRPYEAARLAVAGAAATVGHPGGRPNLTPQRLSTFAARLARERPTKTRRAPASRPES